MKMVPTVTLPSKLVAAGQKGTILETAPSVLRKTSLTTPEELDASKLLYTPITDPKVVPEPNSPDVWAQNVCTDHMVTAKWTSAGGWQAPELKPYGPFSIMPTASVLHYATECFEGLKLYRGYDEKLRLFRPDCNAKRMLDSATRIALPAFDPVELRKLIEALCIVDGEKWLPRSRPGSFLYLRPTMIATADNLGVQRPREALLYVIACCFPTFDSPTGTRQLSNTRTSYIAPKKAGMRLLASKEDTIRAWPGGFGSAKLGANYGPSLVAQGEAKERGYDQVLWLLGTGTECNVTEAGASNFFVVWRTKAGRVQLVTAPLDDKIILDGVTRRSVLQLARERLGIGEKQDVDDMSADLEGLEVIERTYTIHEIEKASEEGRLIEAFVCGTAFFVSPVSIIHFRGKDIDVPMAEGTSGAYATMLKMTLRKVMYGEESNEWGHVVEERTFS